MTSHADISRTESRHAREGAGAENLAAEGSRIPNGQQTIPFFFGSVDLAEGRVHYPGCPSKRLQRREMDLLRYLVSRRGSLVTRDEMLREVWCLDPQRVRTRTVDMHISKLRQKLRDDPRNPSVLKTINGQGYILLEERRHASGA